MRYDFHELPDAASKTGIVWQFAIAGAQTEPIVRETAIRLVRGLGRDDHVARIERLHQFVRDSIDYVREPIEMIHTASTTLNLGAGDCDDHVVLLGALAWALKYPIAVQPIGDPENPEHYALQIGYPQAETPLGDHATQWLHVETTIPALTGEPIEVAARRLSR